jgi:hypothetical protein
VPPVNVLSQYGGYKPIPLGVAYNQFLPPQPFRERIKQYFFPKSQEKLTGFNSTQNLFGDKFTSESRAHSTFTLKSGVFTRGKFKAGKTISFTHPSLVIPTTRQHETYTPTPNLKLVAKRASS